MISVDIPPCLFQHYKICVAALFKMAYGPVFYAVKTSSNSKSFGVFCNSDCQCCVLMKSEIQALENEVKSLTEIINILKDETKSVHASKEDCKFTCTNSKSA